MVCLLGDVLEEPPPQTARTWRAKRFENPRLDHRAKRLRDPAKIGVDRSLDAAILCPLDQHLPVDGPLVVLDGLVDVREPDQAVVHPLVEDEPGGVFRMNVGDVQISVLLRLEAELQDEVDWRGNEGIPSGEPNRMGFLPEAMELDGVNPGPVHHASLEQEENLEIPRLDEDDLGV